MPKDSAIVKIMSRTLMEDTFSRKLDLKISLKLIIGFSFKLHILVIYPASGIL